MSQKAKFNIQFNLNQKVGAAQNRRNFDTAARTFIGTVVRDVGLRVVEERYKALAGQIRHELKTDVEQEVENIARLYIRHIVGRSGVRERSITLKAQTTETQGFAAFPKWEPLHKRTIARKGHSNFFLNKRGLPSQMRAGKFWQESFGPISVRVHRTKSNVTAESAGRLFRDGGSYRAHFSVARIEVFSLGKITPAMLGQGSGRDSGLLDLLPGGRDSVRVKLGGWNKSGNGHYRPSLEPFLSFALTRAIPAAVSRRIETGNGRYPNGALRVRL